MSGEEEIAVLRLAAEDKSGTGMGIHESNMTSYS